ncbi:MAG: PQQ-binding-like beta-propeller repeat protein, partial [Gemmataceae bacterium]
PPQKYPEAVAQLSGLLAAGADDLIPQENGRLIPTRLAVHATLARLPAKALAEYRQRLEPLAAGWLKAGDLRRVIQEAFVSKAALVALDRLGDQAFLIGDWDAAARYWSAIAPLEPSAGALVHPDPTEAQQARAQAKQLLARRFAGRSDFEAALAAFRKRFPCAEGPLAGQRGNYAELLSQLQVEPADTRDWPTFAGNGQRAGVASGPSRVLDALSRLGRKGPTFVFDLSRRVVLAGGVASVRRDQAVEAARRLAYYPALIGSTALVNDGRYITAYDLRTGKTDVWFDAADYLRGVPRVIQPLPRPDSRYTLSVAEGHVFARVGASGVRDVRPIEGKVAEDTQSAIVCLREGKLRWMAHASDPARKEFAVFEGSPLVVGERCYVAVSRFVGDRVVTAIHCYAAFSEEERPAPLWKVDVCETRELLTADAQPGGESEGQKVRTRHHLLTQAGDSVVYCSHSGLIVSLDGLRGTRNWAVRYPRRELVEPSDEPLLRDLCPPVCAQGRLYVAPADSDRLLCLDPVTGETLWYRDRLDVVHLLGVGRGRLIFSTWRNLSHGRVEAGGLRAVDAYSGSDASGWMLPDDGAGLIPFGRGLLVGDLVLWPTFRQPFGVVAVRQEDGRQPDNPTLLHRIRSGNLLYANGIFLVTDRQAMYAYVPTVDPPEQEKPPESDDSRLGRILRERDWAALAREPRLQRLDIRDERGLPQAAAVLLNRSLPALPAWPPEPGQATEFRLGRDETFLPVQGGGLILSTRPGELLHRDSRGIRWRVKLGLTPTVAFRLPTQLLVAGAEGVAAVSSQGDLRWHWPAPRLPRWPTDAAPGPSLPVEAQAAEALHLFCPIGEQLLVAQGGRLFALSITTGRCLWAWDAPGAGLNLSRGRGRIHHLAPLGGAVLAQVSYHRYLFDLETGQVRGRYPESNGPWPCPPLALPDGVLIAEKQQLRRLDLQGAVSWRYRLPGKTTRTGQPPLVLPWADNKLVVAIPENLGVRLRYLDARTGRPLPSNGQDPLLLSADAAREAWQVVGDRLIHSDGERLIVRALPSGRELWSRVTPMAHRCRILVNRAGIWLSAREGPGIRAVVRWLGIAVQWRVGPWPGLADQIGLWSLDGQPRGQWCLRPHRLPRLREAAERGGVIPLVWIGRDIVVPGPILQPVPDQQPGTGTILVALGDQVACLQPTK